MSKPIEGQKYLVVGSPPWSGVSVWREGHWTGSAKNLTLDNTSTFIPLELALQSLEMFKVLKRLSGNDVPNVWFDEAQALIAKIEQSMK